MTDYRNRARNLSWLLVLALFLGSADDGFAGKKKNKDGKKKKNKAKQESSESADAGAADDGSAGKEKNRDGKKKKNKDKQESSERGDTGATASPMSEPPKFVKDVESRLLAYDTATARTMLAGASSDSSVHRKIAEGRVLDQEAQHTQAISLLSAASDEASADPTPLVYLGEAYQRANNTGSANDAFSRAEQRARAILSSSPSDPRALYFLGVAQQRQKRFGEAIATLEKARGISPRDALVVYQLGATHAFQRDWPKAIDTLTQAIDLNPGIAYAYYYRGLAAGEAGRKDLLVNDLDRFLAMAPNAPEAEQVRRLLSGV